MATITSRAAFKNYCLENKYSKWYFNIIDKAVGRNWNKKTAGQYCEKHHIVPRAISGQKKNEGEVVYLTLKEHFICHRILTKILKNKNEIHKMQIAFWNMSHTRNIRLNSSSHQKIRTEYLKNCSLFMSGKNNPMYGKQNSGYKHTKKHKEYMSNIFTGKNNPMYGKKQSEKFFDIKCKEYIFCFNNKKIEIKNLRKFCRENNLDQGAMTRINSGKQNTHKGYSKWH